MADVVGLVAGGVIGLATGAFGARLFVEPLAEVRKVRGEIIDALMLYANLYGNVAPSLPYGVRSERCEEAESRFRELAARLVAACAGLPLFDVWSWCRLVPSADEVACVGSALVGLSNEMEPATHEHTEHNRDRRRIIHDGLNARRFWKGA